MLRILTITLRYKPVGRNFGGKPFHSHRCVVHSLTVIGINGKSDGFESYQVCRRFISRSLSFLVSGPTYQ